MIKLYRENRVFRTFVQSFVAAVLANATAAVTIMTAENWWKIMLTTLFIPALSTALAQATKDSYEGE